LIGCFQNKVIIENGTAFMKVIKNKSNNEQLKHCKYFNTFIAISNNRGWTYGKFEVRANFEFNCGATAQFSLENLSEDFDRNVNSMVYTHEMDCINNKYKSWFRLFGQNLNKEYELNKTQNVRLKNHKNNYLNIIRYQFYFKICFI
jgi:beta-glucanase (GH16 family)